MTFATRNNSGCFVRRSVHDPTNDLGIEAARNEEATLPGTLLRRFGQTSELLPPKRQRRPSVLVGGWQCVRDGRIVHAFSRKFLAKTQAPVARTARPRPGLRHAGVGEKTLVPQSIQRARDLIGTRCDGGFPLRLRSAPQLPKQQSLQFGATIFATSQGGEGDLPRRLPRLPRRYAPVALPLPLPGAEAGCIALLRQRGRSGCGERHRQASRYCPSAAARGVMPRRSRILFSISIATSGLARKNSRALSLP